MATIVPHPPPRSRSCRVSNSDKLRILNVVESISPSFGGLSQSVLDMAGTLARDGHYVELVTGDASGAEVPAGVRVSELKFVLGSVPGIGKVGFSPEARRYLAGSAGDCDVIHLHGLWRMHNLYAAAAAKAGRVPLLISTHGMLSASALRQSAEMKAALWLAFQKRVLNSADAIHVTSTQESADVRSRGISTPLISIPHGFQIVAPASQGSLPRAKRMLFLGRLDPIKNLELLIDSWKELKSRGGMAGWELVLAGEGRDAYTRRLKGRAAGEASISFIGVVRAEAKRMLVGNSAGLVLPSHSENFGLVVAEALAEGTPVICSTGTPWSAVVDVGCGAWVEPTIADMTAAIAWFANLPEEERRKMGVRGRAWVEGTLSLDVIGRSMAAAYANLVRGVTG